MTVASEREVAVAGLNGPAIGVILKELVRRAISTIRAERFIFEAEHKLTEGKDDLVTSADHKAQALYVRMLTECFPGFGLIGEEKGLFVPCALPGRQLYFTIDPLDGTKAYGRRQSFGVATQVALIDYDRHDHPVLAAFVGDVNTQEVYGFRPGSEKVHRISEFEHSEHLSALDRDKPLRTQYAVIRDRPEDHHPLVRALLARPENGGLVKDFNISSGSASLTFAQLWKGEVGLLAVPPFRETPWDMTPVSGINEALGIRAYTPSGDGRRFERYDPQYVMSPYPRREELVFVHRSRVRELHDWQPSTN